MRQMQHGDGQRAEAVVADGQPQLLRQLAGLAAQVILTGIELFAPVLGTQAVGFTNLVILIPDILDVGEELVAILRVVGAAVSVILISTLALHGTEMMEIDLVAHLVPAEDALLTSVEVSADEVHILRQDALLLALSSLAAPHEDIRPDGVFAEIAAPQGGVLRAADADPRREVVQARARLALCVCAVIDRLIPAAAGVVSQHTARLVDLVELHAEDTAGARKILVDGARALALISKIVGVPLQQGQKVLEQRVQMTDSMRFLCPCAEVDRVIAILLDGLLRDHGVLVLELLRVDLDLRNFISQTSHNIILFCIHNN